MLNVIYGNAWTALFVKQCHRYKLFASTMVRRTIHLLGSLYLTKKGILKYAVSVRRKRFVVYFGNETMESVKTIRIVLDMIVEQYRAIKPIDEKIVSLLPDRVRVSLSRQGLFCFNNKMNVVDVSFSEMIFRYESLRPALVSSSFYVRARTLLQEFYKPDFSCFDFTRDSVDSFANYLLVVRGLSAFSISKIWWYFVSIFDFACERNYISENFFRFTYQASS
jgi:hypothetical protein